MIGNPDRQPREEIASALIANRMITTGPRKPTVRQMIKRGRLVVVCYVVLMGAAFLLAAFGYVGN